MKKLAAVLLVLCMAVVFCACGNTDNNAGGAKPASSKSSGAASSVKKNDFEEESSSSQLVLSGEDEYVVVCKKGSGKQITKISDIKGAKVGVVWDTDGEKIAEYYGAVLKSCGTEHDCFSDLNSGDVDFVVCRKSTSGDSRVEIALDPIVIEK